MELSIVTLTWNSEKYIEVMLDSLISRLESIDCKYEIIIIDNGSIDSSIKKINKYQRKNVNIVLFSLNSNLGTTKSRNLGIKKAKYENILIVDSDTEFYKTDFKKLLNSFSAIPSNKIGVVQPQLIHTDGEVQKSALEFPTVKNKIQRFFGKINTPYDLNQTQKVDYCISAAWLVKKRTFNEVGLLDENIFYAPEDAEFCKRLWVRELEVWYYNDVQIIHHYQRITSKKKFTKMWFLHLKGLIYFWIKYMK